MRTDVSLFSSAMSHALKASPPRLKLLLLQPKYEVQPGKWQFTYEQITEEYAITQSSYYRKQFEESDILKKEGMKDSNWKANTCTEEDRAPNMAWQEK